MGWNRKVGRRNKDFKKCVCVGGGGGGGGGGGELGQGWVP